MHYSGQKQVKKYQNKNYTTVGRKYFIAYSGWKPVHI
jgi:hypothetical protein